MHSMSGSCFWVRFWDMDLDYNLFKNVDEEMVQDLTRNMPELRHLSLGMLFGDNNS